MAIDLLRFLTERRMLLHSFIGSPTEPYLITSSGGIHAAQLWRLWKSPRCLKQLKSYDLWCLKEQFKLKIILRDTRFTKHDKTNGTKIIIIVMLPYIRKELRLYSALVWVFSDCGIKLCVQECDTLQHLVCYCLIHYYRKIPRRKDQISFYFNIYLHFPGMEMNVDSLH